MKAQPDYSQTVVQPTRILRRHFVALVASRSNNWTTFRQRLGRDCHVSRWVGRLVLEAAAAVLDPIVGSHRYTEDDQHFFDGLCQLPHGNDWCKLGNGHEGECVSDWGMAGEVETER